MFVPSVVPDSPGVFLSCRVKYFLYHFMDVLSCLGPVSSGVFFWVVCKLYLFLYVFPSSSGCLRACLMLYCISLPVSGVLCGEVVFEAYAYFEF